MFLLLRDVLVLYDEYAASQRLHVLSLRRSILIGNRWPQLVAHCTVNCTWNTFADNISTCKVESLLTNLSQYVSNHTIELFDRPKSRTSSSSMISIYLWLEGKLQSSPDASGSLHFYTICAWRDCLRNGELSWQDSWNVFLLVRFFYIST